VCCRFLAGLTGARPDSGEAPARTLRLQVGDQSAVAGYALWLATMARSLSVGEGTQAPYLLNASFESGPQLDGWTTHVYGATPEITLDTGTAKEGRQSLRVSCGELTDTAFGQEVMLKPGRFYRFSGWVRTQGLDPHGAPVHGTFQIQQPGGRGTIASGENHRGDTDWTEVPIFFQAPADGLTRIAIFFVGFEKGTGTAWFDDLKIEEVNLRVAPIKVTREPLCPGEINPFQCGQFIEYLCDLVPGMWAERLYDGSFEGLSPYDVAFIKETDFREKPWHPSGAMNRAEYVLDPETKVSGDVSQRIGVPGGAPCTVGIAQDGIAVRKGEACTFSVYLRQQGLTGPVRVRVHREGRVCASCEIVADGEWRRYAARLAPSETEVDATLSIDFRGPGTLWLDNASLMPEDTLGGWRRDVVEAVRDLKPGIIRFGGSATEYFDWRDTIGDPDRRKPFRAWGGLQPTGPGLEEIVQFCRAVGAEPLICVRFTGRTPKEAADEVEYFNGAPDTPMGALRAKNGHPEPYGIRYWQVANEIASAEYEARLADFCRAMKAVDPTIRLMASFPTPGVLRNAGELLDYVCPHHYGCADLGGMAQDIEVIRGMIREYAPGRDIKIGVTEWNTTAGDWGPRRAMLWTLENALACARYHNLMHRHCDLVEIANRSNLTNSFCSGIIQTDRYRLYRTPTYCAQQLYATLGGTRPLRTESSVPATVGPDISATLSARGDRLTVFAVNDSLEAVTRVLDLSAFGEVAPSLEVWTLADRDAAGEPDVTNSFADPTRVVARHSTLRAEAPRFEYSFPPLSLTVIVCPVKGA